MILFVLVTTGASDSLAASRIARTTIQPGISVTTAYMLDPLRSLRVVYLRVVLLPHGFRAASHRVSEASAPVAQTNCENSG